MRLCLMGLVIGCWGVVGCGPDFRAICEGEMACRGGNDLDVDACVASREADADLADDLGCGSEYDDYYNCIEPFLQCNEQQTGQTCMTDNDCNGGGGDIRCSGGMCAVKSWGVAPADVDACEAESNAKNRCD